MEKVDCPICLSKNTDEYNKPLPKGEIPEAMDSYTVFECKNCGTVWAEGYVILVHGEKPT